MKTQQMKLASTATHSAEAVMSPINLLLTSKE
jgi:hypothetical protein